VSEPLMRCRKLQTSSKPSFNVEFGIQPGGNLFYCLGDDRHKGGARPVQAFVRNVGTFVPMLRESFEVADPRRSRVPMRGEGADGLVVAKKPGNAGGAKQSDEPAAGMGQPTLGGAGV